MTGIPEGFERTPMGGPFLAENGPFYVSNREGKFRLGLRLKKRHCNLMGHCHGGLLATFADTMMPIEMYNTPQIAELRRYLPTISLQLDYIGAAKLSDWIEGEGEVLKVTRSVIFMQGLVRANGTVVTRCSGIYNIGPKMALDSPGMFSDELLFETAKQA